MTSTRLLSYFETQSVTFVLLVNKLMCFSEKLKILFLYMSSSFPQFSVDKIILRHGSQDLYYFVIIHSYSIILNTATPGAHSIIL